MYYSSGNYEAFAHPKKPEGVDNKSAYLIGSGLAALTAACYLVRDGQMQGDHIHVFEKDPLPGGACDGYKYDIGYVMRGGREMDNHFEVMWDLLRSIPSLETEGASVLDEYYWLNKEDPNKSLCRATVNRGQDAHTDGKFAISDQGAMEIMKLFFTPDEQLQDKKITDIFDDEVFSSNFWMYWRTMFAFENWHSALEMKLYLKRYIHHIGGLPDFTALRFTRYNQYESIILPMVTYLKDHGVDFQYETKVTDVQFRIEGGKKQASSVTVDHKGESRTIDLTENDLLFILHCYGSHFSYHQRYPREAAYFLPDDDVAIERQHKQKIWNAYDNSIRYTDTFLSSVIGYLASLDACSALLYSADHGEDILDDDRERFLHASPTTTAYQLYVASLAWFSEDYRTHFPEKVAAAEANETAPATTHALFHTMADMASIRGRFLTTKVSLVSPDFDRTAPRRYLNDHNEAVPFRKTGLRHEDMEVFRRYGIEL